MKFLMKKCVRCGRYTFKDVCPVCNGQTTVPHPPRFSPEDKYVKYRVLAKLTKERPSSEGSTLSS
ncbi:RNA-protein complex protein Nop10 [Ignicoccus hospitalis]|uniref:Ribosome biogenesis protein Nop10 n=1 Tax=Ignicoccus hospitalis (strain KIN4/I / DSM 18386 / JCM 14125) TaxID=453591 RepID=NOP10_IGNH4|nr:RNA-protein complex protein Nop10 [Ignicoccus hospitalis]A8AAJ4.1 RecName: Full=Ribosome biogenesis protein Nop10 [Ignicoccus hospitalis KIN4/I]ABU81946.1 Nucleolar RNA-binding protein Nop10p [Ignicoccus hospitalis KIN4/I]HIH89895.1 RNA-protein complex protein Nop10 [Desulfurococcaceae archaeon]